MKHGGFLMTIGTGLLMAGSLTAGRSAMQSPSLLYLAGQLKMAVGDTDSGMRLMNEAAKNGNSKATPATKHSSVSTCALKGTSSIQPKSVRSAKPAVIAKTRVEGPVLLARLENVNFPIPPAHPLSITVPPNVPPAAYTFNAEQLKAEKMREEMLRRAQQEVDRAERIARVYKVNYRQSPNIPSPEDIQREVEMNLGQVMQ